MNNTPCQFCPFAEALIYLSLPPKTRCTLTGSFHRCDNTECDAKRKMIPIEWIRQWCNKSENTYSKADVIEMLNDWEKENEADRQE